jgi:hypothetical protein
MKMRRYVIKIQELDLVGNRIIFVLLLLDENDSMKLKIYNNFPKTNLLFIIEKKKNQHTA